jgi:peroxiredoxin Q/BCP
MSRFNVGDRAPLFKAVLQDGSTFDLAAALGKRMIVLFFYPKDDTPVCTKEACGFRDSYEKFVEAGAEVIGVSSDSPARHLAFAARHRLPFPIISDQDRSLRKLFGVPNALGFVPGRVTYVIDKDGIIRLVFSGLFTSDEHVRKALAAVSTAAG